MTDQEKVELLATRVMGWRKTEKAHPVYDYEGRYEGDTYWVDDEGDPVMLEQWKPTRNIADAWMIVKQMAKADPVTSHRFQWSMSMYSIYDITPERICDAALQVVEASAE